MHTLEDIKEQLPQLLVNRRGENPDILFNNTPAFKKVHTFLNEDETLQGYCISSMDIKNKKTSARKWMFICTEFQVQLIHYGAVSGNEHIAIPISTIQSVQTKKSFLSHSFLFETNNQTIQLFQSNKTVIQIFQ